MRGRTADILDACLGAGIDQRWDGHFGEFALVFFLRTFLLESELGSVASCCK